MSEIPASIKKKAKSLLAGVEAVHYARWGEPQIGTAIIEHVAADIIAKAIWAERQRCAKIADDLELDTPRYLSAGSEISCFHNGIEFACDRISQAILNQTEE